MRPGVRRHAPIQLADTSVQLRRDERYQDEVVGAHLGVESCQARYLHAQQHRDIGARTDLAHPADSGTPHLQVSPGIHDHHRRAPHLDVLRQRIDVVSEGQHFTPQIAQRSGGGARI